MRVIYFSDIFPSYVCIIPQRVTRNELYIIIIGIIVSCCIEKKIKESKK